MIYEYKCAKCGVFEVMKPVEAVYREENCPCCRRLMTRKISVPKISGTRDGFGIGKSFTDETTGKTVDNWNTWEKLGYRSALETHKGTVKEKIKRKVDKITNHDSKRKQVI